MRGPIVSLYLFSLIFLSCKDTDQPTGSFDRKPMLEHYASRVILPAFRELELKTGSFRSQVDAFLSDPSSQRLEELRSSWYEAALSWQSANCFNFGPAGESGLKKSLVEEIGTFPTDTALIGQFIDANDTLLNNFDRDTRGFFAIEYLLFRSNALVLLQSDDSARSYLRAITAHLYNNVAGVVQAWEGGYSSTFLGSVGTDAGSSTAALYNEFVRSFEQAKNFKVGLPAGKRPGQTQAEPFLVEGYFSGFSLPLLEQHLKNLEFVYWGKDLTGLVDGPGLRDYLQAVVGGADLVIASDAQWQLVLEALDQVPDDRPLSGLMAENNLAVERLHTELQKHTRFYKSEMSSLLGIAITFASGDGD